MVCYPYPLHSESASKYAKFPTGHCPQTKAACRDVLSLPIHPDLTEDHQAAIVRATAHFYRWDN